MLGDLSNIIRASGEKASPIGSAAEVSASKAASPPALKPKGPIDGDSVAALSEKAAPKAYISPFEQQAAKPFSGEVEWPSESGSLSSAASKADSGKLARGAAPAVPDAATEAAAHAERQSAQQINAKFRQLTAQAKANQARNLITHENKPVALPAHLTHYSNDAQELDKFVELPPHLRKFHEDAVALHNPSGGSQKTVPDKYASGPDDYEEFGGI